MSSVQVVIENGRDKAQVGATVDALASRYGFPRTVAQVITEKEADIIFELTHAAEVESSKRSGKLNSARLMGSKEV